MLIQQLKYKFCLCRSFDHYNTDPGSQAAYHNGHKVAFFLWPKWIRTVECGILVIKKTYVSSLQIRLYSVFLNVPCNLYPVFCNLCCASFLVTPCLVLAVQPCMEWIPIKKKRKRKKTGTWKRKRKKFYCKRKITFFYLHFPSIAILKKLKEWFTMSSLFLEFISILFNAMYSWFILFAN